MEEINVNLDDVKPLCSRSSTKQEGPRRFPPASVLGLGLLAVFLLAGLIGLAVHQHNSVGGAAADLSAVKANLTERLHASDQLLSSVTEERDGLMANLTEKTREVDRLQSLSKQNQDSVDLLTEERDGLMANLTEKTREVDRLQSLSKQNQDSVDLLTEERDGLMANLTEKTREVDRLQKKTCPAGWRMVSFVCYLFSTEKASWQQSRQNCRAKGADLVIIDSNEEQKFMTSTIKEPTWIGLNDIDQEGTWKWVDGSQPNQKYWGQPPDNGNGDPKWGEEDCACLVNNWNGENNWNDLRCTTPLQWICEKIL
ncbi:CD209 antigen-like protein B [Pseudochaenichthys georgianus]|uniref:CD209 antigen-like protein B n=1 Tax=Pseudochaenichthys georgianus TaxID=52239 RepID=UPI00146E26A4|nr:hepatic lectin-like [Pseudochaenichthys georgianus]